MTRLETRDGPKAEYFKNKYSEAIALLESYET